MGRKHFAIARHVAEVTLASFFLSSGAFASEAVTYSYDAQGRIVEAAHSGSGVNTSLDIKYQYDLSGNRLSYIVTGSKNQGQQVIVVPINGFTIVPVNP